MWSLLILECVGVKTQNTEIPHKSRRWNLLLNDLWLVFDKLLPKYKESVVTEELVKIKMKML